MEGFKQALQDKRGKISMGVLIGSMVIMGILGLFHIDSWLSIIIPGFASVIACDRFVALVHYYNGD